MYSSLLFHYLGWVLPSNHHPLGFRFWPTYSYSFLSSLSPPFYFSSEQMSFNRPLYQISFGLRTLNRGKSKIHHEYKVAAAFCPGQAIQCLHLCNVPQIISNLEVGLQSSLQRRKFSGRKCSTPSSILDYNSFMLAFILYLPIWRFFSLYGG